MGAQLFGGGGWYSFLISQLALLLNILSGDINRIINTAGTMVPTYTFGSKAGAVGLSVPRGQLSDLSN